MRFHSVHSFFTAPVIVALSILGSATMASAKDKDKDKGDKDKAAISIDENADGERKLHLLVQETEWAKHADDKVVFPFHGALAIIGKKRIPIEMKTRGQGSLKAPRRNYGISLEEKIKIGTIEGKNFDFSSMWADQGYISSKLGFLAAQKIGVSTLESEFLEINVKTVDGAGKDANDLERGLYLVTKAPKAHLKDTETPAIIRRRYYSKAEIKYVSEDEISRYKPKNNKDDQDKDKKNKDKQTDDKSEDAVKDALEEKAAAPFLKAYDDLYKAIDTESGDQLYASLQKRMDIDGYMKWMAMNSLFQNGDTADEIFLYVDADKYKRGEIYFHIAPWDFDDMFKKYHPSPINLDIFAKFPKQIILNFEDRLDLKIAKDARLLEIFKSAMNQVLTETLDQKVTDDLLDTVFKELKPYLDNESVLEMSALDKVNTAENLNRRYTYDSIVALVQQRKDEINARRQELLDLVPTSGPLDYEVPKDIANPPAPPAH